MPDMTKATKTFDMLSGCRFISHHEGGIDFYFDSRHRVIKAPLTDGSTCTLVQDRQSDGTYFNRMISFVNPTGERTLIEY